MSPRLFRAELSSRRPDRSAYRHDHPQAPTLRFRGSPCPTGRNASSEEHHIRTDDRIERQRRPVSLAINGRTAQKRRLQGCVLLRYCGLQTEMEDSRLAYSYRSIPKCVPNKLSWFGKVTSPVPNTPVWFKRVLADEIPLFTLQPVYPYRTQAWSIRALEAIPHKEERSKGSTYGMEAKDEHEYGNCREEHGYWAPGVREGRLGVRGGVATRDRGQSHQRLQQEALGVAACSRRASTLRIITDKTAREESGKENVDRFTRFNAD